MTDIATTLRARIRRSGLLAELDPTAQIEITGLPAEAEALLVATMGAEQNAPIALITPGDSQSETLTNALRSFHPHPDSVCFYPNPSLSPYQHVTPSLSVVRREAETLARLAAGEISLLVISARALLRKLPSPEELARRLISLAPADEIDSHQFLSDLLGSGYARVDLVSEVGEVAYRGGIIDIFPPDREEPIRIELFGDTIESIRSFEPEDQRSGEHLSQITIAPISPFPVSRHERSALASLFSETFNDLVFRKDLALRTELLLERDGYPGWENDLHLINETTSFPEIFSEGWNVLVFEPEEIAASTAKYRDLLDGEFTAARGRGEAVFPPDDILASPERAESLLATAPIAFSRVHVRGTSDRTELRIDASPAASWSNRLTELVDHLKEQRREHLVVILHETSGGIEKTERLFRELELPWSSEPDSTEGVVIAHGTIERGFTLDAADLTLLSEWDLYEHPSSGHRVRRRRKSEAFASDLRDLKTGDLVVHVDHGIARFRGLDQVPLDNGQSEVMILEYDKGGRLLVPMQSLHLIQKYSGADQSVARLDRLGGASWERRKASVRKAMRDMTGELLELYARRSVAEGHAFSPDSPWQSEFEASFEFEETPDQTAAIAEIKSDMETRRPMDRLLCGDVGYGKTEVAMRAAFKAVMDGKQVAVLAPTTVLAYQHYTTLLRRFASFPIFIELTSRLRTAAEQKEIAEKLGDGEIDILIGTHRLLSKELKFKDLGLLIIDEEQRFGVAQKEKLKKLKQSVDVLAMSATPIPRTLNMSLSSIRDISLIETPPRDRLAIQTAVVAFDDDLIREAIDFELERGGQVFFVHNRVDSIEVMGDYLQRLVPEARIAVGHGQMNERALEDTMLAFIRKEYDILLATTIIENGIDIPAANTILINHAERFGLSQLYQLRGRVGRSDKLAFCYLLVPSEQTLADDARRRLAAIQEFSALGAGFRIAARDLEIRGGGNLLGGEQSGHIGAVGFEMYMKLLDETIAEIRGEAPPVEQETSINLGFDISIPADYIDDENIRMMFYKRIASATDPERLAALRSEVRDRFGKFPRSVENLFDYVRLKSEGEKIGVSAIARRGGEITLKFLPDARVDPDELFRLVEENHDITFSPAGVMALPAGGGSEDTIRNVMNILETISPGGA